MTIPNELNILINNKRYPLSEMYTNCNYFSDFRNEILAEFFVNNAQEAVILQNELKPGTNILIKLENNNFCYDVEDAIVYSYTAQNQFNSVKFKLSFLYKGLTLSKRNRLGFFNE